MLMKTLKKRALIVDLGGWLPCDSVTIWSVGILNPSKLKEKRILLFYVEELCKCNALMVQQGQGVVWGDSKSLLNNMLLLSWQPQFLVSWWIWIKYQCVTKLKGSSW